MTPREPEPLAALAGEWQMVRAEFDGEHVHELVTSNTRLTLGDGVYEVRFGGEVADAGTAEATVANELSTLVLAGLNGPNAGRTIRSLYQMRGVWLRICYGLDGVLPDAFTTAAGTRRYLATYKRVG
ncbi:hypothetical protein [Horticoccus sp. 23ND18S-11]|uniref:hypothetical protein n=1 Tax=Horticoccus sp. 23ND18S-11 TaxID=3391832 RepID=UPI0039C8E8F0